MFVIVLVELPTHCDRFAKCHQVRHNALPQGDITTEIRHHIEDEGYDVSDRTKQRLSKTVNAFFI